MRTFDDLIKEFALNNSISLDSLTYCHSTKYKTLLNYILPELEIKSVSNCEYHDNENLVFMFYGKASYYPPADQKDSFNKKNPPITLVYENIFENEDVKRICCFDSGAYVNGILNQDGVKPDPKTLKDFTIDNPTEEQLMFAIQALYGNNENYLQHKFFPYVKPNEKPLCRCLAQVDELYNHAEFNQTDYGPQAFSIEVQVSSITQSKPIAIAVPFSLASSEEVIEQWKNSFSDAEILVYGFKEREAISVAYGNMREKVIGYNENL